MNWAPDAQLDDGLFNVVLISDVSKLKLVLNSRLVYAGRVSEFPGITQFKATRVLLESNSDLQGEADGELYAAPPPGKLIYQIVPGLSHSCFEGIGPTGPFYLNQCGMPYTDSTMQSSRTCPRSPFRYAA